MKERKQKGNHNTTLEDKDQLERRIQKGIRKARRHAEVKRLRQIEQSLRSNPCARYEIDDI